MRIIYLFFFHSPIYRKKISEVSLGANINNIRNEHIDELDIPIYSNKENKIITDRIRLIQDIIEKRKSQLYLLDELIKARFVELFGEDLVGCRKQLSELASISGGLTKNSKRCSFEIKFPYLRVANVFFNKLDLSEILEIGVKKEEIDKTILKKGDLLFVEGNGSLEQIGRVAIWDGSIAPILHQNHLIKARFETKDILPQFALFYFMSQEGRRQIVSKSVSTSGLNTLSVNKIGSLLIPVPPLDKQNQFADFVHQVDKSKLFSKITRKHTNIIR